MLHEPSGLLVAWINIDLPKRYLRLQNVCFFTFANCYIHDFFFPSVSRFLLYRRSSWVGVEGWPRQGPTVGKGRGEDRATRPLGRRHALGAGLEGQRGEGKRD